MCENEAPNFARIRNEIKSQINRKCDEVLSENRKSINFGLWREVDGCETKQCMS
jgi:hypothetical protein